MKVAIVRAHAEDRPGAVSMSGETEWDWSGQVQVAALTMRAPRGMILGGFSRRAATLYERRMRGLCARINEWGADAVVSTHYNASGGRQWGGGLALHWPWSSRGRALAQCIAERCGARLRVPCRPYGQDRSWSGGEGDGLTAPDGSPPKPQGPHLHLLKLTKAPAVILEPGFGDSPKDWPKLRYAQELVAKCIIEGVAQWGASDAG